VDAHVAEALQQQVALNAVRAVPAVSDWPSFRLDRGVFHTPDGDVPVEKIGHGMFSDVYRERGGDGRVFAFTREGAYEKEVAASAHAALPDNPHLPAVEQVGHTRDRTAYVMPHYKTPLRKGDSPAGWRDYVKLRDCRDVAWAKHARTDLRSRGYPVNSDTVDCARAAGATPSVVEAAERLRDQAADYGASYVFEFSPRNLASDAAGNLVLLDVLFDLEQAERVREEQRRAHAARERELARRRW
jgi:hypothetical protein